MKIVPKLRIALALTSIVVAAPAAAASSRDLLWSDLRTGAEDMRPTGEIVIKGFVLPVDREGELVYEFMLVPWIGACSHTPPPPLDQIVFVRPAEPYRLAEIYEPVAVRGVIEAKQTLSQLFLVDGVTEIGSGYAIRRARVEHAASMPDAVRAPGDGATPWKFLKK